MTPDDGARRFDALTVREAQEALAEELDAMNEKEASNTPALADEVVTAREAAEHLRMAEALLFAAVEPLDVEAIAARLPEGANVPALLETLKSQYEARGVVLSAAAGRYRFVTATDIAHVLEREKVEPKKLTRAALETLAIIAYHQPCTRADIEDVRGVAVSPGSLDQLMEIGWVRMRGRRKSAPGRPILYATTQAFLEHFNLESVGDLPGMADLKAAGLLDARLPPGFAVPTPLEDAADEDIEEILSETEFVTDFHGEEAAE
jgi:segregation and condensation protein B